MGKIKRRKSEKKSVQMIRKAGVKPSRFLIVMGVAGSSKTSVGKALASQLGWHFYDADDFHPQENRTKMENGFLDDSGAPWLATSMI
jgi:uridine kinase